tara:strand:- start:1448 stop:1804 length:357 start_codon:yes stop_codon:yes gene_type:complete
MQDIYYVKYLKYKNKYLELKNKIDQKNMTGGSDKKEVYLFKADWCPHCKAFLPVWEKLSNDLGSQHDFVLYDGDKNKDKVDEWKVDGFPTIIVKKGNDAMEYMGPNEYNSVSDFIRNI